MESFFRMLGIYQEKFVFRGRIRLDKGKGIGHA